MWLPLAGVALVGVLVAKGSSKNKPKTKSVTGVKLMLPLSPVGAPAAGSSELAKACAVFTDPTYRAHCEALAKASSASEIADYIAAAAGTAGCAALGVTAPLAPLCGAALGAVVHWFKGLFGDMTPEQKVERWTNFAVRRQAAGTSNWNAFDVQAFWHYYKTDSQHMWVDVIFKILKGLGDPKKPGENTDAKLKRFKAHALSRIIEVEIAKKFGKPWPPIKY